MKCLEKDLIYLLKKCMFTSQRRCLAFGGQLRAKNQLWDFSLGTRKRRRQRGRSEMSLLLQRKRRGLMPIGSEGAACAARVSGMHYISLSQSKNTSPLNIALPMWSKSLHRLHVTEGSGNRTLTDSGINAFGFHSRMSSCERLNK